MACFGLKENGVKNRVAGLVPDIDSGPSWLGSNTINSLRCPVGAVFEPVCRMLHCEVVSPFLLTFLPTDLSGEQRGCKVPGFVPKDLTPNLP